MQQGLSTSLHGWVKEERTYEHHGSYPQGFTQGCRRQPDSPRQEDSTHFWSVLPIAPERRRPLKSEMGPDSSFSREAQEYLLYCNAQVYARAEGTQREGTSPSVLPTLQMGLPQGLDTTMPDGEVPKLMQLELWKVYNALKTQERINSQPFTGCS